MAYHIAMDTSITLSFWPRHSSAHINCSLHAQYSWAYEPISSRAWGAVCADVQFYSFPRLAVLHEVRYFTVLATKSFKCRSSLMVKMGLLGLRIPFLFPLTCHLLRRFCERPKGNLIIIAPM